MKSKSDMVVSKAKDLTSKVANAFGSSPKTKDTVKREKLPDNPLLSYTPTDSLESDCKTEADIIKQALRDADQRIAEESRLKNSSEFWFCMVFESEDQKAEFIKGMGWDNLPMQGDKYFDGTAVARLHKIPLQKVPLKREKGSPKSIFTKLIDGDIV